MISGVARLKGLRKPHLLHGMHSTAPLIRPAGAHACRGTYKSVVHYIVRYSLHLASHALATPDNPDAPPSVDAVSCLHSCWHAGSLAY